LRFNVPHRWPTKLTGQPIGLFLGQRKHLLWRAVGSLATLRYSLTEPSACMAQYG
jgi:hypothetical protein